MSPAFRNALPLVLAASLAQAGETRIMSRAEADAWPAVGRLDVGTGQLCTATMIAPDVVVTSGWCVRDPITGGLVYKNKLSFRAGMFEGTAAAARRAVAIVAAGAPAGTEPCSPEALAADVALIGFGSPIRADRAGPLPTGPLPEGAPLTLVHYGGTSANAPSFATGCRVDSAGARVDCEIPARGGPGAPLVAGEGADRRVVAVVAGDPACAGGPGAALAPIGPLLDDLRARLDAAMGRPSS